MASSSSCLASSSKALLTATLTPSFLAPKRRLRFPKSSLPSSTSSCRYNSSSATNGQEIRINSRRANRFDKNELELSDRSTPYLVVSNVPSTMISADIIRALDRAGAFKGVHAVSLSEVIRQPLQFEIPNTNSSTLDTNYHLTFENAQQALFAQNRLKVRPWVFTSVGPALHNASGSVIDNIESSNGDGTETRTRKRNQSRSEPTRRGVKTLQTSKSGFNWYNDQIKALFSSESIPAGFYKNGVKVGSKEDQLSGPGGPAKRVLPPSLESLKAMAPVNAKLRGRQVLLRGLPPDILRDHVVRLVNGVDLADASGDQWVEGQGIVRAEMEGGIREGSVKRMVAPAGAVTSHFLITLPDVSSAYRVVRQLHMRRYATLPSGFRGSGQEIKSEIGRRMGSSPWLMTCEVIW